MAIYTKTGDKGTTSIFGGKRISKSDSQIEASGSIDELTSSIGYVKETLKEKEIYTLLTEIQKDLYKIMGSIAGADIPIEYLAEKTKEFEQKIDFYTAKMPELHSFILPDGTKDSSLLHVLRVTCRRAERRVVDFSKSAKNTDRLHYIIAYLNRLSDLFFTLARWYAKGKETTVKL